MGHAALIMQNAPPSARKLSYSCGAATVPLLGKCVGEVLDDTAAAHPENDALIVRHQQLRYTYAELRTEVERAARGLLALGIERGDRVGIWATNCAQWVITQFATAKIGAILVNINPSNRAYELEYALSRSECQTLLLIQGFRDVDYVQVLREICPEAERASFGELHAHKLPELRRLIFLGANGCGPTPQTERRASRHVGLERIAGHGRPPSAGSTTRARVDAQFRRCHQYPVHLGNHRATQGRDVVASQRDQQRDADRQRHALHASRPAVHSGALLSLLRHGAGESGLRDHRGDHGDSRALL